MLSENLASIRTPEMDKLAFTVLAIEASAKKMNISPSEMRISNTTLDNGTKQRQSSTIVLWIQNNYQ